MEIKIILVENVFFKTQSYPVIVIHFCSHELVALRLGLFTESNPRTMQESRNHTLTADLESVGINDFNG